MPLPFERSEALTLGVEMELQIVDASTRDLSPGAPAALAALGEHPKIKPEIFQAMLEVNTGICRTPGEVRADLAGTLRALRAACAGLGLRLASAGSHPFARHSERILYPAKRYEYLIDRNRWLARRLMVFGLHVHVGMRDGEHAMAMINGALPYLPHLLALSASSPYWQGGDTGLCSSRITIFEALPTAGHPCTFDNWAAFESAYDALIASRAITSIKDIWWDIRPHPDYGTVEVRICDALPTLSETVALVALTQSLFAWLDQQYASGVAFAPPPYWALRENKWRASRSGLDADVVLDERGRTEPLHADIDRLLEHLEPIAVSLGCEPELRTIGRMAAGPLSYRRQRQIVEDGGSLPAVVDALLAEFDRDLDAAPLGATGGGRAGG